MKYWTTEEKDAFKALVATGISGSKMAGILTKQFGREITRSAIGGMASRLKLRLVFKPRPAKKHDKPKREDNNVERRVRAELHRAALIADVPQPQETRLDPASNCTVLELTGKRCHYPLWPDQSRPDINSLYCGVKTTHPPYCKYHRAVMFRSNREPPSSLTTVKEPANPEKSGTR